MRLRDISLPAMPGYRRLAAEAAWREAAGPALALRSRVRLEAPGVLEVRVPDERWRATVAGLEKSLIASLQGRVGGEGLRRLHLRIDTGIPSAPLERPSADSGRAAGSAGRQPLGGEERLRRIARMALARRGKEP